jgi:hypothetical protein
VGGLKRTRPNEKEKKEKKNTSADGRQQQSEQTITESAAAEDTTSDHHESERHGCLARQRTVMLRADALALMEIPLLSSMKEVRNFSSFCQIFCTLLTDL